VSTEIKNAAVPPSHERSRDASVPRPRSQRGRSTRGHSKPRPMDHHKRGGAGSNLALHLRSVVGQNLNDATFIVFDIETTGGNPERNGITEIAALKVRHGVVIDKFYSLINPMIPIPPIVRKMTGITNQLVKDSPVVDEIFPDFLDFIGDDILVSHNTIGDLIFLRHFAKDTVGRDLKNFFMCTHLLVEKLFPETPDKSLKGLSKFFAIEADQHHRAEADALQTFELFKIIQKKLTDRGMTKIEHAIRLQGDMDSSLRLGWSVPEEKLKALTDETGLFYLFDHERRLLFLSSAIHMAAEVQKLLKYDLVPRQVLKLALKSYDIQSQRSPNILSALLSECDGREKNSLQVDPSLLHQRQVQVIGIYEDKDNHRRIAVGPIEPGLRYAFGPVKDRKRALDFIVDLAEILNEKSTRSGMLISPDNRAVVVNLLSGTLDDLKRKVENSLFGLRILFWRRTAIRDQQEKLEKIANLVGLGGPNQSIWPALNHWTGIIVVPDGGQHAYQIHTIIAGLPTSQTAVKGHWRQKLKQGGLGKRMLSRIESQSKEARYKKSFSNVEIAKLNAVLWWIQHGKNRDGGTFLRTEEFRFLLEDKTSLAELDGEKLNQVE
jgi:DNA polymerase III subunit epsilon